MRNAALWVLGSLLVACGGASTDAATPSTATNAASTSLGTPSAPAESKTDAKTDAKLTASIAGPQRPADEKARDGARHPKETLEFFGLRDDMHVIELSVGTGWYTSVLAPVLKDSGALTVTTGDPNGPPDNEGTKQTKALMARFAADPGSFSKVTPSFVDWKKPDASLGTDGSADMVLTFRSLHGWVHAEKMDQVFAAAFRVLKHGGVFGVVEHRAAKGAPSDPKTVGDTGYVPTDFVLEAAKKAGFVLAGTSEVNANAKDTKNYSEGVWTLPPTLKLGDQDRAKYLAIGESDRMTLKLTKP